MKRIAPAITGLVALALLFTGAAPAQASTPSTVCQDGWLTEVQVLDSPSPLYIGVETSTDPAGPTSTSVCYKDRAATGVGGYVNVTYLPGSTYAQLSCAGDLPATVAVNCHSFVDLNFTDPDPSTTGYGVSGWVKVEGVSGTFPLTGAEVGIPASTETQDGTVASLGGRHCVWVLGLSSPTCTLHPVSVWANYEPEPVVTTASVPACAGVFVGGGCIGTWVTVPVVDNAYLRSGDYGYVAGVYVLDEPFSVPFMNDGCTGYVTNNDPACA